VTDETKAGQATERGGKPVLVLLGGIGDLSLRMLLPSLYNLDADRLLPEGLRIIAVARKKLDKEDAFADLTHEALVKRAKLDDAVWKRFRTRLSYVSADMTTAEGAGALAKAVGGHDQLAIFFAVSPSLFGSICASLKDAGLTGPKTRLVLEKPVGRDLESSRVINAAVASVVGEDQTFRIDHYLGKETVQNLAALRFANVLFEPLWNNQTIDHVQITVAETEGVGDRWPYYDEYGALRDMVQNHMMQLLCLVAMEPPSGFDPDAVRSEKVKVLKSLRPFTAATVAANSVRGQYGVGVVEGKAAKGYVEEVGKPTGTETFVALKAEIDNWRWAGVPFFLRTGKRLPERRTTIVIQFKAVPYSIFSGAAQDDLAANRLVIDLQPDEDIELLLMNKRPDMADEGIRLQQMPLSLSLQRSYAGVGGRRRIAYERLLLDVFRGDRTLFVRRDEVEEAWRFVDGVAHAWDAAGCKPQPYLAGAWGPDTAAALIGPGRRWHV
jgi:glucose-6-phosphate 1-dehydrogenase